MVDGVPTALALTHDEDVDGTSTVSNTGTNVAINAGDEIVLRFVSVNGPPVAYNASVVFE